MSTSKRLSRTALIAAFVGGAVLVPTSVGAFPAQPQGFVQVIPAPPTPTNLPKPAPPAPTARGELVTALALTKLGAPYVWGGTGPDGFDCSGLIYWAFGQIGVAVPRTSEAQAEGGVSVPLDALLPGDVVVYYSDAHHVGLYIGNGRIVHASMEGVPIQLAGLHDWPIYGAYRYV